LFQDLGKFAIFLKKGYNGSAMELKQDIRALLERIEKVRDFL
jgi:hypothetical protein